MGRGVAPAVEADRLCPVFGRKTNPGPDRSRNYLQSMVGPLVEPKFLTVPNGDDALAQRLVDLPIRDMMAQRGAAIEC
jgi:hypothetical protein